VLTAGLVHAAELAIPRIPAPVAPSLAEAVGTVAFAASPRARNAVRANLAVIAPDLPVSARRVFVEQVRNYLEIFRIPHIGAPTIRTMVERRGWENFTRAADTKQGVIVASAHLGPISLVGQILSAHDYTVVLPIEIERSEFQRAVNRARRAIGLQLVSTETPLAIVRALREGKVFGLLADRAVTGVGERVPFFGREALLPSVHIALALRIGVPIIPAFSGREGDRLVASFEPPLELVSTGDRDADVREGVRRWALVLERYVRRAPEQWTVFERVWADG
jgi:Kdo2-lipid IVA lauroyltransferase/acyltransferase